MTTETKFTPAPLKVAIDGTMTGLWAEIRQECVDPKTNELWERELCRTDTTHVRRDEAYPQHGSSFLPFEEAPEQFRPDENCEEALANAQLWATAPRLYSALQDAVEFMESVDPGSFTLREAREALAEAIKPAEALQPEGV